MALPEIASTDFTGWLKISTEQFTVAILNAYITQFHEDYTRRIIGSEATDTVVNNAITSKWTDLFAGVYYFNISKDKNIQTSGLTEALKRYIYFEYGRDNFINSNTGYVRNLNENSTALTPIEVNSIVSNRYNDASARIRAELKPFIDNYENFEGTIDSFVDNGGNSYTINSSNTKYLEDTDTVTINGIDYVVSSVVDDTSFNITGSTTGLSFTGSYFYSPYESVDYCKPEIIF